MHNLKNHLNGIGVANRDGANELDPGIELHPDDILEIVGLDLDFFQNGRLRGVRADCQHTATNQTCRQPVPECGKHMNPVMLRKTWVNSQNGVPLDS
ncbi:MAG: hypothetical protein WBZ31_11590 [Thiobacillus sp.]